LDQGGMSRGISVGLDIGSLSAKLAATFTADDSRDLTGHLRSSSTFRIVHLDSTRCAEPTFILSDYRRVLGNPLESAVALLDEFRSSLADASIDGIRVTGSGGRRVAEVLGAGYENELKAIARGVSAVYPDARTIFEMGGESSKYLLLDCMHGNGNGRPHSDQHAPMGILDYSTSSECAAGTGSFIDQQASRLQYRVEEIGTIVSRAKSAARIAGRCSVFAKSDMIHAQQRGYGTDQVLKGLCEAVARNFKSNVLKGKKVMTPVVFIGGVSQNAGVVQALVDAFRLAPTDLIVPEHYAWFGALGAALFEVADGGRPVHRGVRPHEEGRQLRSSMSVLPSYEPLSLSNVLLLRDHPEASRTEPLPEIGEKKLPAYLGIDIGSVSTNLAVLDEDGRLLHGIYLRTVGRPIEVVHQGLQEIAQILGSRIEIVGVGTTGSGRELIGELVGADTVNDEITAHKTGAMHVHERLVRNCAASAFSADTSSVIGDVDTIFEIGGQDSKFISIDHGVVVDFAMNEACAAGTGSFLEEQAERLGIQIQNEFARLALASRAPARLGERCTVFMERDVTSSMQRGAQIEDLTAGLAYSVVLNYLNRIVRGRRIGEVIYFQGGTAYNDAVAAAFSSVLGKRIIVPPHNGIIGAIGMALIAQEVTRARCSSRASHAAVPETDGKGEAQPLSLFRGYDLSRTRFETREFVCKACSNYCDMKEITIEGQKTYWGDKCSDKFRKRTRTERKPVIDDLLAFRDRALFDGHREPRAERGPGPARQPIRIGIPQTMFFYDQFPFWRTYLEVLGFDVVVSEPTDRHMGSRGAELSLAEPCFPVQIAHGHVQTLLEGRPGHPRADYILLPNVVDMEAPAGNTASKLCPWNQTLPFVVRSAPEIQANFEKILVPTVHFRLGVRHVKRQLAECFFCLGVRRKKSDSAVEAAYRAQANFEARLLDEGRKACAVLEHAGEPAVLLVGRPYNIYDSGSNCHIPRKLRDFYGVNVVPLDFLPLDDEPVCGLHPNMFWHSGRRILAAGRFVRDHPNLHIIYITNFKCGPDSFIKHFLREVVGAPFLVLQFDGHGNDAGYLTRCEAYLDSKGILRCSYNN
jgi:predicted CoA-substrate-specific enzyme activase